MEKSNSSKAIRFLVMPPKLGLYLHCRRGLQLLPVGLESSNKMNSTQVVDINLFNIKHQLFCLLSASALLQTKRKRKMITMEALKSLKLKTSITRPRFHLTIQGPKVVEDLNPMKRVLPQNKNQILPRIALFFREGLLLQIWILQICSRIAW